MRPSASLMASAPATLRGTVVTVDAPQRHSAIGSTRLVRKRNRKSGRSVAGVVLVSYVAIVAMMSVALALTNKQQRRSSIGVTLSDTAVAPSKRSVSAGVLDLTLLNAGTKPHELVVLQTDLAAEQLPLGDDGRVDDTADGVTAVFATSDQIASGDTAPFAAALVAGDYVLICNLPGHYEAGMRTSFTVTPRAAPPAIEQVSLVDFSITSVSTSVAAGLVDFRVYDKGPTVHEFLLFRTDLDPTSLPVGADGRVDEEADGLTNVIDSGDIDIGTNETFNTALTTGHYLLICNLLDHYKRGMYRAFAVT
jgi:uncharacterized cupredoxin-like copper-binding protein